MAMTLVYCRVCGEEVIISLSFYIPHIDSFCTFQDYWKWLVVIGTVFFLYFYIVCTSSCICCFCHKIFIFSTSKILIKKRIMIIQLNFFGMQITNFLGDINL